jgi:cytoskeletal protein RodZ
MKKLTKYMLGKIKKDEASWLKICHEYVLSESFIRQYQDKVYWDYVSCFQKLSEDFIREFKDKVNWKSISEDQKLSEDFVIEFQDKIYFLQLMISQNLHNYSYKTQKLIMKKTIFQTNISTKYCLLYFTDYMKEEYKKVNIFL